MRKINWRDWNKKRCLVSVDCELNRLYLSAKIKTWAPFYLTVAVGHGRVAELNSRIKAQQATAQPAAEIDRTRAKLDELIHSLAGQALVGVLIRIRRIRGRIDSILTILFTLSTALYLLRPFWPALAIDALLVAMLAASHLFFGQRETYIQSMVKNSFREFRKCLTQAG